MGGCDVGCLRRIGVEVVEGVIIYVAEFVVGDITFGTFVGRDEGVLTTTEGQTSGSFHNHAFAPTLTLAKECAEHLARVQSIRNLLSDELA